MRTVGASGPINEKTYLSQSLMTFGYAVKAGTVDGSATAVTGAGQRALGIVSSADVTQVGYAAPVVRSGDTPAIAGAAIPFGAYVKTDATGRLVPVTGTVGDGEEIVGRAESTASGANDEFLVFVCPSIL